METMDPAALMAIVSALTIPILILAVVQIIAYWKIYEKAGQPGWAAIVPIYNIIVLLDIVGKPRWWILLLFIPFVNIVIGIIITHGLSKAFGHGAGFTLGLIFLSLIFLLILAFGSSQYQLGGVSDPEVLDSNF